MSSQLVSRKDFLKLMTASGIGIVGAVVGIQNWKKIITPPQTVVMGSSAGKGKGYEIIDGPMDVLLDAHWNNIASANPDVLGANVIFLRTSPNPNEPLHRQIIMSEKQLVFIPWRTAQYDKDDGIPKDSWIETAWKDMREGDQPGDANLTIDGQKIVPGFSEPHFTSTIVSKDLLIGGKLVVPFKKPILDEVRESVTTGYGVLVKLAKGSHEITSAFRGSNNYMSSGQWSIQVV